ncbi:MAG: repressor LexA [Ruminococcaceae bacterium]|nr:repressor LexA [Oscillospiraceae bacterium]
MRSKKNPEYLKMLEEFIDEYIEKNHTAPTISEITDGVELPRSTVGRYIAYMREQGVIDYEGHRSITTRQVQKTNSESVKVPVLGSVSCGVPKLAIENIEEYIRLPVALFGRGDFFILRANGDSMIEAGIEDGDLVLIRVQNYADPGQIVVALMDDEATLKRFYPEPEKRRIRLHPENSALKDIYVKECIIQGIAVKVLKDLE